MIACIERGGRITIAPAIFSPTPTARSGEYVNLVNGVWMNTTLFGEMGRSSQDSARLDQRFWNEFWNCIVTNVPSEAAACGLTCTLFLPAYGQCLFTCITSQAVTTAVRCLLTTSLAQSLDNQEREVE